MAMVSHFPITVIGDGYAAAMVVWHSHKNGIPLEDIAVVGGKPLGQGFAYGTTHPDFRLNVADKIMVVDPENPELFPNWAVANIRDDEAQHKAGWFYRRADFAHFVNDLLDDIGADKRLSLIQHRAVDLKPANTPTSGPVWQVILDDSKKLTTDMAILATGNPPPAADHLLAPSSHLPRVPNQAPNQIPEQIIDNPWNGDKLLSVDSKAKILMVGGGLTAMDACLSLFNQNHRGQITIITPHGLLPPPQSPWEYHEVSPWPTPLSGAGFVRHFRKQLPAKNWQSEAWQSAFESVRLTLAEGWALMSQIDRGRVTRRLGWLWSLARYRSCPQTWHAAETMLADGRLNIISGRVAQITPARKLTVRLTDQTELSCDNVIVASGLGRDALIDKLTASGTVGSLEMFPGLSVDQDMDVLTPSGHKRPGLKAIGAPTRFSLGDSVGAATIARHASLLAASLKASA